MIGVYVIWKQFNFALDLWFENCIHCIYNSRNTTLNMKGDLKGGRSTISTLHKTSLVYHDWYSLKGSTRLNLQSTLNQAIKECFKEAIKQLIEQANQIILYLAIKLLARISSDQGTLLSDQGNFCQSKTLILVANGSIGLIGMTS